MEEAVAWAPTPSSSPLGAAARATAAGAVPPSLERRGERELKRDGGERRKKRGLRMTHGSHYFLLISM
jgi:hypothetical protein